MASTPRTATARPCCTPLAGWSGKDDLALQLTPGADKTAREKNARLPVDRVPRPNPELRDLMRG